MSETLDFLPWPHEVIEGPWDVGSERRFLVRRDDGQQLVVGQLAADLAREEAIRRRYVRDTERLQERRAHALAPTVEIGPSPDPRDPHAVAPWRARVHVEGETLEHWLMRAPIPLDEFAQVFAALADALASVHADGAVLRDLRPSQVVRTSDGRIVLLDVGLSRVDVLSSHTASSLLMQGSAYVAPEQVHRTAIDERSDLFGLGVMMWHALVGSLPFGDSPAFLRDRTPLPSLVQLRPEIPPIVDALVHACLHEDPSRRPATAHDVAWVLRGGATHALADPETTACQHCGERLRVGQRLCLSCGRVSVCLLPAAAGEPEYGVDLRGLKEDANTLRWLQDFVVDVAQPGTERPDFIAGSSHLYAEEERRHRIRLPARMFGQLKRSSAQEIAERMQAQGLDVEVVGPEQIAAAYRQLWLVLGTHGLLALLFVVFQFPIGAGVALGSAVLSGLFMLSRAQSVRARVERTRARFSLRSLPAALPASDPLVARLAALLRDEGSADIREVVSELALLVQRAASHRAQELLDPKEFDMLTEPLAPLVTAVERLVAQLYALDETLASLDEGTMVRALAASHARRESPSARTPTLQGLDRLRVLEDERAAIFHRLLGARSLLTRTVELGLTVHDDRVEYERQLTLALATLEP